MADKIFMKRVLIPLWIVQLLACIIVLGLSALALYAFNHVTAVNESDNDKELIHVLNVGAAIPLALSVYTIVADIVEIVLTAKHKLRPVANIVLQCVKSAIWTFYFVVTIIGVVQTHNSGINIFLALLLFCACLGQLVYGSVILHRYRKGTLNRNEFSRYDEDGPSIEFAGTHDQPVYPTHGGPYKGASVDASPAPPYPGVGNDYYAGRYEMR